MQPKVSNKVDDFLPVGFLYALIQLSFFLWEYENKIGSLLLFDLVPLSLYVLFIFLSSFCAYAITL